MSRRPILLASGIAALLFLGVLAWMLFPSTPAPTKKLADGSTITLLKITTGTNHVYVPGNILQRTAARFLSDAWLKKLNITRMIVSRSSSPWQDGRVNQVVWVSVNGPVTMPPKTTGTYTYSAVIRDEGGGEISGYSVISPNTPGGRVHGFCLSLLPTGSRMLNVQIQRRVFTPGGGWSTEAPEILAGLDIPNPVFIKHPAWHATPLPVQLTQDDFDLTLFSLGPPDDGPSAPRVKSSEPISFVHARLKEHTGVTNHWSITKVRLIDEAGAESQGPNAMMGEREFGKGLQDQDFYYLFPGRFSTNSLYKVRFTLTASAYARNESITFPNVPIPGRGTNRFTPLTAKVDGFTISITNFTINGDIFATLQPPTPWGRLRCVRSDPSPPGGAKQFSEQTVTSNYYHGQLWYRPASISIDLTFEWKRERIIDVIVRPTAAKSSTSP